jgi:ankyrin repeat protein
MQLNDELPIHCCVEMGDNPNVLELMSILLQINSNLVNAPNWDGMLPIHLAASCSTVEVMQMLYEYSSSSINFIVPRWGSVANMAARSQKLDILNYIHTINPELILMAGDLGWTPLSSAVAREGFHCAFIKALYALGPTAISKVPFY